MAVLDIMDKEELLVKRMICKVKHVGDDEYFYDKHSFLCDVVCYFYDFKIILKCKYRKSMFDTFDVKDGDHISCQLDSLDFDKRHMLIKKPKKCTAFDIFSLRKANNV